MNTSLFGDDEADGERLDRAIGRSTFSVGSPDEPDLPTETALALVYPRLVPEGMATDEHGWGYATSALPGTATLFVYDLPEIFYYLNQGNIERHGADEIADAAIRNLREIEELAPEELDHGVWALQGHHAGAHALILPETIWRCTGQTEFPDGVLFATPTNELLLYHVPRDATIAAALENIAALAVTAFENDDRRRVTPSAYWWDGDQTVERVTELDADTEQITIYLSGEFEEMYYRLQGGDG
jgi:hypothetical protein